jgi:urocanate hydratase
LFYVPSGLSITAANQLRESDPEKYKSMAMDSMAKHVRHAWNSNAGAEVF